MTDILFNCPFCKQPLKAKESLCGEKINCSSCKKQLHIPYFAIDPSEMATEKQIAYIKTLGGATTDDLTKAQAMEIIDNLRVTAPPTKKQLNLLKKLGAKIPEILPKELTSESASELIAQLLAEKEIDIQLNKDRISDFYKQEHEKKTNGSPFVVVIIVIISIFLLWFFTK